MWHNAWHDAPLLNRITAVLVTAVLLAFAFVAIKRIAALPAFAIERVVVTGAIKRSDPAYLASVIQQGLRGTFFTIDLAAARDALGKVQWVRTVAVRRQWPATLEVNVVEHQPLARWNDVALVNTEGEVFDAEYGEELPDFYGPDGFAAEMTQRYREFATSLKARDVEIDTLTRSARGAWDVRLDDGIVIALGREQIGERWMRWIEISERYGDRIAQGGQLATIDLRYANGFAARIEGMPPPVAAARKNSAVQQKNAQNAAVQQKNAQSQPARTLVASAAQRG
jgi:cell division protein FtsQ